MFTFINEVLAQRVVCRKPWRVDGRCKLCTQARAWRDISGRRLEAGLSQARTGVLACSAHHIKGGGGGFQAGWLFPIVFFSVFFMDAHSLLFFPLVLYIPLFLLLFFFTRYLVV